MMQRRNDAGWNKGGYIMVRGEYEEFLSKFCESSDRYASGFVVDEYD